MIPNGAAYDSYPSFADSGTRVQPSPASKYAQGFLPGETFPAEWQNWFMHGATSGITRLNTDVLSIKQEINNILAEANMSADEDVHNQAVTAILKLIETKTGILTNLNTTEKANLVAAINELVSITNTLDTASTYKAGSASGELPINGSALGTTDNNIVVTDTDGKLKPSGTVIGSAAGKTAGSANGNVPLNGAALGTTEYNVVVTDASGNLKPYGKTAPKLATYGLYIETDTSTQTGTSYTFSPTGLDGLSIAKGDIIKLTFRYALQTSNASGITAVKLNIGGANGNIQSVQAGTLTNVKSHQFAGGNYSSTYKYKVWDAYTTLELMWTGSAWLVMGNPVLCSYFASNAGYTVYANGLIEQWGLDSDNSNNGAWATSTITFNIYMSSKTSYSINITRKILSTDSSPTNLGEITKNPQTNSIDIYCCRAISTSAHPRQTCYYIVGY